MLRLQPKTLSQEQHGNQHIRRRRGAREEREAVKKGGVRDREAVGCKGCQPQDLGNAFFASGEGHCIPTCCLDSCDSAIVRSAASLFLVSYNSGRGQASFTSGSAFQPSASHQHTHPRARPGHVAPQGLSPRGVELVRGEWSSGLARLHNGPRASKILRATKG